MDFSRSIGQDSGGRGEDHHPGYSVQFGIVKSKIRPWFAFCLVFRGLTMGLGQYWNESGPKESPSSYVLSPEGRRMELTMWDELVDILEKVVPGCSGNLRT